MTFLKWRGEAELYKARLACGKLAAPQNGNHIHTVNAWAFVRVKLSMVTMQALFIIMEELFPNTVGLPKL